MYRDSEFSYRDFKCDCYQAFGGLWCVDFHLPNSTAPMQTAQATRKADAMREAKAKMDRWLMTDLERATDEVNRLREQLAASEASRARLLGAVDEIRMNARNLLAGGLPHFSRKDFALAVAMTCDAAIAAEPAKGENDAST